ncbi:MAG: FAD-dependent monooxygenase [Solirubrobacteraceae bacterium]|nr:FAD-dependent monooxygenase [Solirubrobacteraceae bacterium]
MTDHDVVIVGSRLAGTTAASALARKGRDVVVLDRARFPSDTLSTHVLFGGGIEEIRRMGAFERIAALDPSFLREVELHFGPDVKVHERWGANGRSDYVLCVPRPEQDAVLVDVARGHGADVREGCELLDVLWRAGRAAGVRYRDPDGDVRELRAKLVIGADGRRSTVAARVGAWRPYRASRNGRGLVFRYLDDPQAGTRLNETLSQWRDGTSICMVFPSAPRPRAVALVMGPAADVHRARRDPDGAWAEFLRRHPGFAERIAGATNVGKLRSTADTTAYFRPSSGPGWALAGDAGHFKDPIIGQGQRDALWMGRTLGEAAEPVLDDPAALDAALRRWEQERDQECLSAYHFANNETRIQPQSPVLVEIARRAQGRHDPDLGDMFARIRDQQEVLTLPRLMGGAARAIARHPGHARDVLRSALPDLRTDLAIRAEIRRGRFRSTRPIAGSEHPGWTWPATPRRPTVDACAPTPAATAAASGPGGPTTPVPGADIPATSAATPSPTPEQVPA